MEAGAFQAQCDAVREGGPRGVRRGAFGAEGVAREGEELSLLAWC